MAATLSAPAHESCRLDVSSTDVDGLVHALQARQDSLAQLVRSYDASREHESMWLEVTVRSGVVEQIGQLQILKLLVELREAVSGQENKQKVGEAEKAVMRTVVDNADALQSLVGQGRTIATRDAVAAELSGVAQVLKLVAKLGGDCHGTAAPTP